MGDRPLKGGGMNLDLITTGVTTNRHAALNHAIALELEDSGSIYAVNPYRVANTIEKIYVGPDRGEVVEWACQYVNAAKERADGRLSRDFTAPKISDRQRYLTQQHALRWLETAFGCRLRFGAVNQVIARDMSLRTPKTANWIYPMYLVEMGNRYRVVRALIIDKERDGFYYGESEQQFEEGGDVHTKTRRRLGDHVERVSKWQL